MEKEFVPYEFAVKLKALGFDEPCFGYYDLDGLQVNTHHWYPENKNSSFPLPHTTNNTKISAPTFSQAFRWFRERYSLCIVIKPIDDKKLELGYNLTKNGLIMGAYTLYEKAELACLDKLIELTFKLE